MSHHARQLAKTLQNSILHPSITDVKEGLLAVDCLHYVTPKLAHDIFKSLEAATGDTYPRVKALIQESARFNGKILEGAKSREEACSFDPQLIK